MVYLREKFHFQMFHDCMPSSHFLKQLYYLKRYIYTFGISSIITFSIFIQRLYDYIETKEFVGVLLKQYSRWVQRHSLCLSADPAKSAVFLDGELCLDSRISSFRNN
jgi:hypothetical protein